MNTTGRSLDTPPVVLGTNRAVRWIVALSVALYFLQVTVFVPADVQDAIGFASRDLGHRWWTLVTYTLVHANAWPMATNLLVIGTFGTTLERHWGTSEFLRYYFVCALGAWIAHLAFVSGDAVLAGSAAPAVGTLLAYAAIARDERHLRVGAVALTAGWLVLTGSCAVILSGVVSAAPGEASAYLAHTGGVVAGWMYLRATSSVNLSRIRDGVSQVADETDEMPRAIPRGQGRAQRTDDDVVAQSNAALAREAHSRQAPSVSSGSESRDANALDRLLDKISAHGIDSLTADERTLLDEVSRRLRDH